MALNARRIDRGASGEADLILLAMEDVTGRERPTPGGGSEAVAKS